MADSSDRVRPIDEKWLKELSSVRTEVSSPGYWTTLEENCAFWSKELSGGRFWSRANEKLDQWRTEYHSQTGSALLTNVTLPEFVPKSHASVQDKLRRLHARDHDKFSKIIAPDGAPVPRLPDLVRTRVACRYIDGVEFLAGKLQELAAEMKMSPSRSRKGSIEGYFAQHVDFKETLLFRFGGQNQTAEITCEVQIASEMATRMWDASHPFYEAARVEEGQPQDWQWKAGDKRFIANELGHMIHLADGLLVQLRNLAEKGKP